MDDWASSVWRRQQATNRMVNNPKSSAGWLHANPKASPGQCCYRCQTAFITSWYRTKRVKVMVNSGKTKLRDELGRSIRMLKRLRRMCSAKHSIKYHTLTKLIKQLQSIHLRKVQVIPKGKIYQETTWRTFRELTNKFSPKRVWHELHRRNIVWIRWLFSR